MKFIFLIQVLYVMVVFAFSFYFLVIYEVYG